MKSLKFVSLVLLSLFVIGNAFVADVAADSNVDKTIDVKVNDLFELKMPTYPKDKNKTYYWVSTFDSDYIRGYSDMNYDNWCFKALKKGKTTIMMQLHEVDSNYNNNILKTLTYTINIK